MTGDGSRTNYIFMLIISSLPLWIPALTEMYLHSRCGTRGVDGEHSTSQCLVLVVDLHAVFWQVAHKAVSHHWSQKQEED